VSDATEWWHDGGELPGYGDYYSTTWNRPLQAYPVSWHGYY